MNGVKEFASVEEAYCECLSAVLDGGSIVSPRSSKSIERCGISFRIKNPRARLIFNPERRWSLGYAFGELLWHLSGSDDLDFISYYSSKWRRLSSHDKSTGSSYGHKIFSGKKPTRWLAAKALLTRDRDTRRCVIPIFLPTDLQTATTSKDVPCCTLLQFLIRDNKLCMINFMRSNDLMYGFTYDIFLFTFLQELMAVELGVKLGWYLHDVGSLHLYDKDIPWARRILSAEQSPPRSMTKLEQPEELIKVLRWERKLRKTKLTDQSLQFDVSPYWQSMLESLRFHKLRRAKASKEILVDALNRVGDPNYQKILRRFL